MAKQLVFEDEARQPLAAGVSKLARAVVSTLGPRGRNAVLDKGWGAPKITKDGVTVAKEIELDDPFENLGAQLVKEAASKTGDVAGDGTTTATLLAEAIYLEGLRMVAAGADPMALGRGIHAAKDAVIKAIEKMAVADQREGQEGNHPGRHHRRQQRSDDRRRAGRRLREGRQERRDHRRGRQAGRDHRRRGRGHAVRSRLPLAAFRHQPGRADRRVREVPGPDSRRKDLQRQEPDPAVGSRQQGRQAAADYCRGRRGRGPGHLGGQQAARDSQRGRGQGARLWRPPQGHARRHRRPDRRQRHLQGPRRDARFGEAFRPGHGQEGQRHVRRYDDHRRRPAARRPSTAGPTRSARRSRPPPATTTARSSRSGWPSWPAAWPRSTSGRPPRRK